MRDPELRSDLLKRDFEHREQIKEEPERHPLDCDLALLVLAQRLARDLTPKLTVKLAHEAGEGEPLCLARLPKRCTNCLSCHAGII